MKVSEFRKLIREEVRKVIKEERPLRSGMIDLLDPMIKGMYDQFNTMDVTPSIVNIQISSDPEANSVKVYNTLVKNREAIKSYLMSNNLPSVKIYLCKDKRGFGDQLVTILLSKPKPSSVFTVVKETQI